MTEREGCVYELASPGPGGTAYGIGLLGATGSTYDEAKANRLLEIERRILALEAALRANKDTQA